MSSKSLVMTFRLKSEAERQIVENRAASAGLSLAAFLRNQALSILPTEHNPPQPHSSPLEPTNSIVDADGEIHETAAPVAKPATSNTPSYKPARDCVSRSRCTRLQGACDACRRRDAAR